MPRCARTTPVLLAALLFSFNLFAAEQSIEPESDASADTTPPESATEESAEATEKSAEEKDRKSSTVVVAVPEAPPRQLTHGEITRELELRRRALEDLLLRTRDKTATQEELEQIHDLVTEIADLEHQLEQIEAQERRYAPDDRTVQARWSRFRMAFQDITNWDIDDGMFRIRAGLRIQVDTTLGKEDSAIKAAVGSIDTGTELRRARVFAQGRLFRKMDFNVSYDFGVDNGLKDAFLEGVGVKDWVSDHFRWRIGKFQEPFSLARSSSANNVAFMEIGLPADALAPGRNIGIMFRHPEKANRVFWAGSFTTNSQDTADNPNNSNITLTGRVTGLPVFADNGRRLVHVGASYSRRRPTGEDVRYRARPEARFAPFYADTGNIAADTVQLSGFEAAAVSGSNWIQGEWIQSKVDASALADPRFDGIYIEVGRFLTGETRFYDPTQAVFGRLRPNSIYKGGNPFRKTEDRGAFEITARFSTINLNDGMIQGGELRDLSLGLNWYIDEVNRVMLNYVHSDLRNVGKANLILLRYQFNP